MTRFLFLCALAACGGQITDIDGGVTDASKDVVVQQKDAAKTPKCDLVASDYGTSCTSATDCAYAFLGNVCTSTCACENDVISASSFDAWEADFQAVSDGGGIVCPCPPPEPPSCCKGTCVVGPCP